MGAKWLIGNIGTVSTRREGVGSGEILLGIMWGYRDLWALPNSENPFPSWVPEMRLFCQQRE